MAKDGKGRLQDKVALVTGAGSGIARAAAMAFASEGARLILLDINVEAGRQTEHDLRSLTDHARFVECDVSASSSVKAAMDVAAEQFGRLDVLFNCAGGSELSDGPIHELRLDVWDRTVGLNLLGPFLCCRHALEHMLPRRSGTIVNMSSHVSLIASARPIYSATKAGINSLTRSLAAQYSRHGIRANAIACGTVRSARLLRQHQQQAQSGTASAEIGERAALGELYPYSFGDPEDVAAVAVFLASEESRMVNGATLACEGGRSAYLRVASVGSGVGS